MSSSSRNINQNGFESRLAPRTPHSRAGRPVSTFDEAMNEDLDEVDMLHLQSQQAQQSRPLLQSAPMASDSDNSGTGGQNRRATHESMATPRDATRPRSKSRSGGPDVAGLKVILDRTPLYIGLIGAFALFVMIILSFHRPDVLQKYIAKTNSTSTSSVEAPGKLQNPMTGPSSSKSMIIDYSNYTYFPLEPMEYEEECYYLMNRGGMSHGDYWKPMHGMENLDVPHEYPPGEDGICSSTITYMLDGNVGLLYDLALLAQTAALAREVRGFETLV